MIQNYLYDEFIAPELCDQPLNAMDILTQCIDQHMSKGPISLIGSSLGGFYATWLAQKYKLKAALLNPAVNPHELLIDYLGKNKNFHTGEEYEFTHGHIKQLEQIIVDPIQHPKNLMVLL